MIIIDYANGSNPQKRFVSEAHTITIGRSSPDQPVDLDLTPDTSVSRRHAQLTFETGSYWLKDMGSKAGTRVNEQVIEGKTRLAPGDKVRIGLTLLEIYIPEEGMLANSISATIPAAELLMTQKMGNTATLDAARHRLVALYELGISIGSARDVDTLLTTVAEHLCRVMLEAQRAAVLLQEDGELICKAHIPAKSQPPVSLNMAQTAIDNQEAFTWRNEATEASNLYDSVIRHGTQAAMYAPLVWQEEVFGVVFVDNTQYGQAFDDDDLRLLMAMANQIAMFIKNHELQQDLLHQEVIRSNLLRQFSPQVADRIEDLLKEREGLRLGGERAEPVTILTSDVRGFTALSAEMEPSDVVQMLNELFSICTPIIFKYNGAVDKYVGDAILAVFGSPEPDDHQWEKAVQAAIEMQVAIEKLDKDRAERGLAVCKVGIGIHTGAVLHGFIGAEEQMEYTVIGDAVNRASRYCDGAGPGEIMISEAVYERVTKWVEAEPKMVKSKHPETEPDLPAYLVKGFKITTDILESSIK